MSLRMLPEGRPVVRSVEPATVLRQGDVFHLHPDDETAFWVVRDPVDDGTRLFMQTRGQGDVVVLIVLPRETEVYL